MVAKADNTNNQTHGYPFSFDSTVDICPNIKYDRTDKDLVKKARAAQKDRYDKAMNKELKAVKEGIEKGAMKKPPALVWRLGGLFNIRNSLHQLRIDKHKSLVGPHLEAIVEFDRGYRLKVGLDSCACSNVISSELYYKYFKDVQMELFDLDSGIQDVQENHIPIIGFIELAVKKLESMLLKKV